MVNINEIKIAGRIVEEAVDAAATAIHGSPTANRLLEASGLHMPTVSTPNILGEKIGCLLTPDKIKGFAEDLFGKLDSHPSVHYELEDRLSSTGWNQSRKKAIAEQAILKTGVNIEGLDGLEEVNDTNALYAELKGAPKARGALTSFVGARREFLEATSAYNKAVVGPKFRYTYAATASLVEQTGLIKPRLKVSNQLLGADASYLDFTVSYSSRALDESSS